jgi:hypothetical protein
MVLLNFVLQFGIDELVETEFQSFAVYVYPRGITFYKASLPEILMLT